VKCGEKVYNRRDIYQLDEPNPKFFDTFEFNVKFPGAWPLEIEAYDFDDLFGDELIGKTVIDLDDRQYSPDWKSIKNKPIEFR
jgi:Ca2+-dependent lipid-binding protein